MIVLEPVDANPVVGVRHSLQAPPALPVAIKDMGLTLSRHVGTARESSRYQYFTGLGR